MRRRGRPPTDTVAYYRPYSLDKKRERRYRRSKPWMSVPRINGKRTYVGTFHTQAEAEAAAMAAIMAQAVK
jgi:hypothetical protein